MSFEALKILHASSAAVRVSKLKTSMGTMATTRLFFLLLGVFLLLVSKGDVAFDAIVDSDGTTVRFHHADGEDRFREVADFCARYVNASLAEHCQKALLDQIESIEAERRVPTMTLQVQVALDGTTAPFVHHAGEDLRIEASAFCTQFVSPANVGQCTETIVLAARRQAMLENTTLWERLFGSELVVAGMQRSPVNELLEAKRNVAILFAADWCGPCRQFVPKLIKVYERLRRRNKNKLEVVWVSASRTEDAYQSYHAQMPWPAMTFNLERLSALQQALNVVAFPSLLILDSDGKLITSDGVTKVSGDPYGLGFPYRTPIQRIRHLCRSTARAVRTVFSRFRRSRKHSGDETQRHAPR